MDTARKNLLSALQRVKDKTEVTLGHLNALEHETQDMSIELEKLIVKEKEIKQALEKLGE